MPYGPATRLDTKLRSHHSKLTRTAQFLLFSHQPTVQDQIGYRYRSLTEGSLKNVDRLKTKASTVYGGNKSIDR